jgi:hypothetical protein
MSDVILSLKSFSRGINQSLDKQLLQIGSETEAAEASHAEFEIVVGVGHAHQRPPDAC